MFERYKKKDVVKQPITLQEKRYMTTFIQSKKKKINQKMLSKNLLHLIVLLTVSIKTLI